MTYTPKLQEIVGLGQASCLACSLSEPFCYLNLEGLLCLGLQTIEALLDSGSKVTQKPASALKEDGLKANLHHGQDRSK